MSVINNGLLLASAADAAAVTGISRSLRFNAADSAYLSRTPSSAGNRKTWTWAGWVKLGAIGTVRQIFTARTSGSPYALFYIFSDDKISFADNALNTHTTAAVYRDPSAWYHLVLTIDTTSATSTNRVRLWVNGILQVWASTTAPTQNADGQINTATAHSIGSPQPYSGSEYFSGYLADIHFIDGQALDPTSFGEFDATTGVWVPKTFSGSYGQNGFRLTFSDNSGTTATTLGKDAAGSNNWSPNNFSVATGAGNDSLVDVPTSSGTDTGVGGEVRGGYCTLNPLAGNLAASPTPATFANGNLEVSYNRQSSGNPWVVGTIALPFSGKWYWEFTPSASSGTPPATNLGIVSTDSNAANNFNGGGITYRTLYLFDGTKLKDGSSYSTYGATVSVNDVVGVAVDMDAGNIYFSRNGSWANGSGSFNQSFSGAAAAFTDLISTGKTWLPLVGMAGQNSGTTVCNFGQRSWAYTPPSGFKALCTTNLPAPLVTKSSTVFDTVLWTGNGSSQSISLPGGFSPDLVWIKARSANYSHALFDTIRGATNGLQSNATNAEISDSDALTAFGSSGFTVGTGNTIFGTNTNNQTFAAWCWDAGSTTVTNTAGSITSSVRTNGYLSIVTYTGNGTVGATVGHSLGVVPGLVIIKNRDSSQNWPVKMASVMTGGQRLQLNTTDGFQNEGAGTGSLWNATNPSSTVITLGDQAMTNTNNEKYIAYCFAPVAGYSAFGSYTGNGSTTDNTFVYTGMRPRFVLLKRSDSTGNWVIWDAVRNSYNVANSILLPNTSAAEYSPDAKIDILSNGFKIRDNSSDSGTNGATYIYFALAESPFQYARAR